MTETSPNAPKKILVAEDDEGLRFSLETLLKREGYTVTSAADGDEAVTLLGESTFDLVLTDLRMPGCDGLAVQKEARRVQPGVRVVLMTCYGDIETYIEAMDDGAFEYVNKPVEKADLLSLLDRALGRGEASASETSS